MKSNTNLLPAHGEKWARLLRFEGRARGKRHAALLISSKRARLKLHRSPQ
ncbi:hypothetical protein [Bradyrhizobium sp. CB3481]|nr:hypothetical protein [Bradyrhizobium sp. CB3481]WFU13913.1 hypothetical protein QA643_22015 [Bradyrhizobium sp. CB3481]